ncbi:MAG: trimeric autotransporter adhesin [Pseudonocardiales bacterium]|jgi:hypothetical protein|nr:trimeric autotransporter adhesin [Pseudonocardiales bacterium]
MARLPHPGSDDGTWGNILNDFLSQAHNPDGTLKSGVIDNVALGAGAVSTANLADGSVTNVKLDPTTQSIVSQVASKYTKPAGGIPVNDLTNAVQASLGKADSSVQEINGKTPDASGLVTLSAADVGAPASLTALSDVNAPGPNNGQVLSFDTPSSKWVASTFTSTIVTDATPTTKGILQLTGDLGGTAAAPTVPGLAAKAPLASPTFTGTVTVPTPTNPTDATTKAYVDTAAGTGTPDATTLSKGKLQLAGDLAGTAASPTVAKVNGIAMPGSAPTAGQVLTATSTSATTWSAPPSAPVSSVAGKTGAVTLTSSDVGLGNIDNTSDANKPISTVTQVALNAKADDGSVVHRSDFTAKGDLLAATGAASYTKLGLGADTQVLTADSTQASGIKWAAPPIAPVTSVAGKTGAVTLTAADASAVPTFDKGAANGVATLDGTTHVPTSQIPDLSSTYVPLRLDVGAGINAKTYGAKGDGTTDDTVAIQAAFTAADAASSVAVIPPGTYLVSAQLNLPNNASLRMHGATIRATATFTGALIVVGALTLRWRDKFIVGGYLDCNNHSDHAIEVMSGYTSDIDGVTWRNPNMHGLVVGNTGATKSTHEMRISRCKADKTIDVAVVTGSIGIYATSFCYDSTFIDNVVVGPETSFQTDGSANTHIAGHGYGISVSAQFPKTVFKDSGSDNIYIGCYPDTPTLYGFWFTTASFRWTIIGGRIYNGSIGLDNTAIGIHIDQVGSDPNTGTIIGVKVVGVDATHRWAADYDGYIGSTKLKVNGCVVSQVVIPSLTIDNAQTINASVLRMTGNAPTIANGSAVGTLPPAASVDVHSRNQCGQVKLGTGTSTTTGALCTVTYASGFQTVPFVTVTPNNAATAALGLYISAVNTTGFTIACQTAPSASLSAASLLASYAVATGA